MQKSGISGCYALYIQFLNDDRKHSAMAERIESETGYL